MNKPNVYISYSMSVSEDALKTIVMKIKEAGGNPCFWSKGSHYSDSILRNADVVVFVTNPIVKKWNELTKDLTRGVRTELQLSISLQKPIFKAYLASDGLNIYSAKTYENAIGQIFQGIEGTRNNLRYLIETLVKENIQKESTIKYQKEFGSPVNTDMLAQLKEKFGDKKTTLKDGVELIALDFDVLIKLERPVPTIPSSNQLEQMFPYVPKEEIETVLLLLR